MAQTRTCRRCNQVRTAPDEIAISGLPTCRTCTLERRRQRERQYNREQRREQREQLRRDPERHLEALETRRIDARLRRERAGKPIAPLTREQYLQRYGNGSGHGNVLPVEPLRDVVRRWLSPKPHPSQAENTITRLAELGDVSERRIHGLLHSEQKAVSLRFADNVCAVLGIPLSLLYPADA